MFTLANLKNLSLSVVLLGCMVSTSAQTLVSRESVVVTAADLMVGAPSPKAGESAPPSPYTQPDAVKSTASNILVRRVFAQAAVAEGLDKDPAVQAALAQARDRILSDAKLARMDEANRPSAALAESYARTVYNANPKRFEAPDQIRARHVLIAKNTAQARAKADALLAELKGGANFETLAKERSDDKNSGARGGDLGLFARGRMVKSFEDAAFALTTPGQLSDVIETQFGYHVIQLVEKKPAGLRSFDEVKAALMRETEAALINEGRSKEQGRILSEAKFDDAAIEAFARSQR